MSLASERRAARERALGLLYEAEAKGASGAEVLAALPLPADPYTVVLVEAVDAHRARIDDLLGRFAEGWSLDRMAAIDRAALRMGAAELLTRDDVPTGVVLSEAVDLASRFSTEGSGRFVNGLLARVAREVRGAGDPQAEARPPGGSEPDGPAPADVAPQVAAVVFDLDGVIRHWDQGYYDEVDERLGLPPGSFMATALEKDRLDRVVDGRLPFEAWCQEVGEELAARHDVDAEVVARAWAESTWRIDLDVMDLVAQVRRRVPVALLSNASTRLLHDLERSGIHDAFDVAISSADIRVAKPAPGAFEAAARALDVPLDRCLFVDDMAVNVEGARAVGMRSEVFTGVDDLRSLCRELGLVP